MNEPVVATRATLRKLRSYVLGIIGGLAFIIGGIVRVETTADQARDTADALETEVAVREEQSCLAAWNFRVEQQQLLVDIVTDLGGEREIVDAIERHYDQLPEPAACE